MLFKDTRFGVKHDHTGRYHCDLSGTIIGKGNNLPYGLTANQFTWFDDHADAIKKAYKKHGAVGVEKILPPKLAKLYIESIMANSRAQARKKNTAALVRHFTTLYPDDPRSKAMIQRSLDKKEEKEKRSKGAITDGVNLPGYGHYMMEIPDYRQTLLEITLIPLPDGAHLIFTATTAFESDTNSDFILEGLDEFSEEEEFFESYTVTEEGFELYVGGSRVGQIVFDFEKFSDWTVDGDSTIQGSAMWLILFDKDPLMELMA